MSAETVLPPLVMVPGELMDIVLQRAMHPAEVTHALLRVLRGLEPTPVPPEDAAIYAVVLAASKRILANYRGKVARNPRRRNADAAQNAQKRPARASESPSRAPVATEPQTPVMAVSAPPTTPAPTPDVDAAVGEILEATGEQGSERARATFARLVRAVGASRALAELDAFQAELRAGERVRNRGAALVARLRRLAGCAPAAAPSGPAPSAPIQPQRPAMPAPSQALPVAKPIRGREEYEEVLAEGNGLRALAVIAAGDSNEYDLLRRAYWALGELPLDAGRKVVAQYVDDLLSGRVRGKRGMAFFNAANEAVRRWRAIHAA